MYKIYLSILMIIVTFFIIFLLSKKYRLDKNQKIIFWSLVLFWVGITVIRSFRKIYAIMPQDVGGLGLSMIFAAQIASAYGIVSCFIRMPIFFTSDILNRRKIFIQIALVFSMVASTLVILKPSYGTLYFSSLAMGICASMLAMFNVLFSETFSKEKAAISASILAVAPLLAEFLSAPMQYIATFDKIKNFRLLWMMSLIISSSTFVLMFFLKEEVYKKEKLSIKKIKNVINTKGFIFVCLLGIIISFMKFSTAGANMVAYSKVELQMPPILIAYMDMLFAAFQLMASVFVGTVFVNKIGLEKTLILGIISSVIFYLIALFSKNYIIVFMAYAFNGFGYGISYVTLISITLQYFEKDLRNISMGIFQGCFALGIFFGDRVYIWIMNLIPNGILIFSQIRSIYFIVTCVAALSISVFLIPLAYNSKKEI